MGQSIFSYDTDGTPDATWGDAGRASLSFDANSEYVFDMALQSDGKVVTIGTIRPTPTSAQVMAIARYNLAGASDATFGTEGKVTIPITGTEVNGYRIAVRSDQRIVLAGRTGGGTSPTDLVVVCLNTDGSIHTGFGEGGSVLLDLSTYDQVVGLEVEADNSILLAVKAYSTDYHEVYVRLSDTGAPVAGFGANGVVTRPIAFDYGSVAMAKRPGGGFITLINSAVPLLRAFNEDGTPDTDFGTNGTAALLLAGSVTLQSLLIQPDGRIVLGGSHTETVAAEADFLLVRRNPDGSADLSFGSDGLAVHGTLEMTDLLYDLAWSPDGSIVGAGRSRTASLLSAYSTIKVDAGSLLSVGETVSLRPTAYPNPCTDRLTITQLATERAFPSMEILDLSGRRMDLPVTPSPGSSLHIDVSPLKPGLYMITTLVGNKRITTPFVKR